MIYLALVFVMLVMSSMGVSGAVVGALVTIGIIARIEWTKRVSLGA